MRPRENWELVTFFKKNKNNNQPFNYFDFHIYLFCLLLGVAISITCELTLSHILKS